MFNLYRKSVYLLFMSMTGSCSWICFAIHRVDTEPPHPSLFHGPLRVWFICRDHCAAQMPCMCVCTPVHVCVWDVDAWPRSFFVWRWLSVQRRMFSSHSTFAFPPLHLKLLYSPTLLIHYIYCIYCSGKKINLTSLLCAVKDLIKDTTLLKRYDLVCLNANTDSLLSTHLSIHPYII